MYTIKKYNVYIHAKSTNVYMLKVPYLHSKSKMFTCYKYNVHNIKVQCLHTC